MIAVRTLRCLYVKRLTSLALWCPRGRNHRSQRSLGLKLIAVVGLREADAESRRDRVLAGVLAGVLGVDGVNVGEEVAHAVVRLALVCRTNRGGV